MTLHDITTQSSQSICHQNNISQFQLDETLIILDVLTIDLPSKRMIRLSG